MRDIEQLFVKAIPRAGKGDAKAEKLRAKVTKVGRAVWKRGPKGLKKIGVKVGESDYTTIDGDDDTEFLEGVRGVLGDQGFVLFVVAAKKEFARLVAERKAGKEAPAPKPAPKPKPKLIPAVSLEDSAELEVPMGDLDDLALPPDESNELAVPPDEPEDAGIPDLDDIKLEVEGAGDDPLGIRFGDDGEGDDDDKNPALAAERALARFRRTGDLAEAKAARDLFKRAHKDGDGAVAKGAALGGLALTYLIDGRLDKAKSHAAAALKDFPGEPNATAVLCRVKWPNESEREQLQGSLRRAEATIAASDVARAKEAAKALKKALPEEPFWALILLAVACDTGGDVQSAVKTAWKLYPPSEPYGDVLLGKDLAGPIIAGCIEHLFDSLKADETGKVRGLTVKEPESKSNAVAGAYQIALGLARAALAGRVSLSDDDEQQLRTWIGHGIFLSQHYDHAKEVYGSARKLNRESPLLGEINKYDTECGVMKRAFDKPGVKHKMGKFEGVGIVAYRKALAARLKRVLGDLEGDRARFEAKQSKVIDAILADPARRKALKKRAQKGGQSDPFKRIEALEAEGAGGTDEPKKGGLFGRMKAAATKAIDKAKGAVAQSKRKEAIRALIKRLHDSPSGGWKDADLDALLEQLSKIEPRFDFLDEQAEAVRKAVGRAGDL